VLAYNETTTDDVGTGTRAQRLEKPKATHARNDEPQPVDGMLGEAWAWARPQPGTSGHCGTAGRASYGTLAQRIRGRLHGLRAAQIWWESGAGGPFCRWDTEVCTLQSLLPYPAATVSAVSKIQRASRPRDRMSCEPEITQQCMAPVIRTTMYARDQARRVNWASASNGSGNLRHRPTITNIVEVHAC
jgi:hypothetical protein